MIEKRLPEELQKELAEFIEENYVGIIQIPAQYMMPDQRKSRNTSAEKEKVEPRKTHHDVAEEIDADSSAFFDLRFASCYPEREEPKLPKAKRKPDALPQEDVLGSDFDEIFRIFSEHDRKTDSVGEPVRLEDFLEDTSETFSECMLRLIGEKHYKDVDVYNRVHMDRKLFNKIKNTADYQPTKRTALALAIALKLDYCETQDFIGKAGFTMTHANKRDIIVEFFIRKGRYDIDEINQALYENNIPVLI